MHHPFTRLSEHGQFGPVNTAITYPHGTIHSAQRRLPDTSTLAISVRYSHKKGPINRYILSLLSYYQWMDRDEDEYRTVIVCSSCGNLYAAKAGSDGTLHRIGGRKACICGETEFVEVDSEAVFDED